MLNKNNLDLLDALNIASFILALMNLDANLTQSDKQELMDRVDTTTQESIAVLTKHLIDQDAKLDDIIQRLEELK